MSWPFSYVTAYSPDKYPSIPVGGDHSSDKLHFLLPYLLCLLSPSTSTWEWLAGITSSLPVHQMTCVVDIDGSWPTRSREFITVASIKVYFIVDYLLFICYFTAYIHQHCCKYVTNTYNITELSWCHNTHANRWSRKFENQGCLEANILNDQEDC